MRLWQIRGHLVPVHKRFQQLRNISRADWANAVIIYGVPGALNLTTSKHQTTTTTSTSPPPTHNNLIPVILQSTILCLSLEDCAFLILEPRERKPHLSTCISVVDQPDTQPSPCLRSLIMLRRRRWTWSKFALHSIYHNSILIHLQRCFRCRAQDRRFRLSTVPSFN